MEFIKYIFVRGLSSIVTISVFGLIARRLNHNDLENALTFSLIFGFFASIIRTFPSFAAKIEPSQDKFEKVTAALSGYKSTLQAQMLIAPLFFIIAFRITGSASISCVGLLILLSATIDFDLFRAASGLPMLFPRLFLFGSICALIYFSIISNPTQSDAFISVLIQWIPIAIFSIRQLFIVGIKKIISIAVSVPHTFTTLLIVSFDGLVLNLPLMPFIDMSSNVRIEIAVLIRNFTSSLFILPFLLFLTNKINFDVGDRRYKFRKTILFFGILISSISVFFVYISYFSIISGKSISPFSFFIVVPLFLGFSFYYANARFLKTFPYTAVWLSLSIAVIAVGASTFFLIFPLRPSVVLVVQSLAFFALGLIFYLVQLVDTRVETDR